MKKIIIICISVVTYIFLFTSCNKKEEEICSVQLIPNKGHLVSNEVLQQMGYHVQTIEAYGEFQIRSYSTDIYGSYARCNQFYKGLQIFTGDVNFVFSNNYGMSIIGDVTDSVGISLQPRLDFGSSIKISLEKMPSNLCYVTELGIYDLNAGTSNELKNFVLAWRITPKNQSYPYTIVNDQNNKIISFDDGIRTLN